MARPQPVGRIGGYRGKRHRAWHLPMAGSQFRVVVAVIGIRVVPLLIPPPEQPLVAYSEENLAPRRAPQGWHLALRYHHRPGLGLC